MGCCGGPEPNKEYTLKEYAVSAVAIIVFILLIYFVIQSNS